jgi:S-formylglutathione hydrolase FrmB
VAGANDRAYSPQQRTLYLAARRAGMNVTLMYLPGGHDWGVWRSGLQRNVAWLASQLGITERA